MGEGSRILGILEKLDLLEGQSDPSALAGALEVLHDFLDLLDRFNGWQASYPAMSSSTSYWFKPSTQKGNRPSIWFKNIMIANALHHFWAFKVICLSNIERLRLAYPGLILSHDALTTYMKASSIFDEIMSLSTTICQAIEYLMQDEMKLFGPTSAVLPLRVAFDTFRAGGERSNGELEWCESIFEYIMGKGYHFVTMFFPESRLAMNLGGQDALLARLRGNWGVSHASNLLGRSSNSCGGTDA